VGFGPWGFESLHPHQWKHPAMLSDVVGHLRCPYCAASFTLADGVMRCETGHAFDVARQGYVSLLPTNARASRGDSATMVAARERFLGARHFAPLSDALAAEPIGAAGCVLDLGAGTGRHLAAVLDRHPDRAGLALDSSKYALRRAARANPRIGAVACDAWRELPVADSAAALVLNVFAPRDPDEIARVLAPGGTLLAVTPTPRHFAELVASLGLLRVDEGKPERLDEKLAPALDLVDRRTLEWELHLTRRDADDAAAMGPTAWHSDPATFADAVAALPDPLVTRASVTISAYRQSAPNGPERV
jgi:23S rRNA (guanine745-N1)-methyltransferase